MSASQEVSHRKYINRADGKICTFVSEDDGLVTFKWKGRETLRHLGRAEFDRRFEPEAITPPPADQMEGWTGNKCEPCKGHGVRMQGGEERRCPDCAGTGDEYGPKLPPDDFFDDKFDKPAETDTPLQAAAREAGWALSNLVDEIKFEKRQQVVNIINRLSASLAGMDRRDGRGH